MSIKDAITCKPIPYAKFYLGRTSFKADKNGIVTLPCYKEAYRHPQLRL